MLRFRIFMSLFLFAACAVAQNYTFVQANGQPVTVAFGQIARVQKSTTLHDSRVYLESGSYYTSASTFDSVAIETSDNLFKVTQASTWKVYLFNPKSAIITKTAGDKAVVKVGIVSYTTTADYDSLLEVVDGLASGTSVLGRQPFYRCQLSYSNSTLQTARVAKGYVGDNPTFTLNSTGVVYITMPSSILDSEGAPNAAYASNHGHYHVQVIQTGGGDPTGVRATITYQANNTIMLKVYDANGDLTNAIGVYVFMDFNI